MNTFPLKNNVPSSGFSRRDFVKYFSVGSAVSIASLSRLNASIYQSVTSLNQKYIRDESPDGIYWDALRKHYLFEDDVIMMNNGTIGPMPKPVFNTLVKTFRMQCTNPYDVYNFISNKKNEVRSKLAQFINASPDETVINRNTTEGMNFVANGLDMGPGDEVLISDMEHPAGIHPWRLKEKRYGISVKEVPIGLFPKNVDDFVGSFEKAISSKTKIISISHTVFITGLIAPVKELCAMAQKKGVLVVADGAHAIGMLNLDMKDMGVDFYATSPYKWMGAPTGVGVLYVKKEVQDRLWPTIASSGWDSNKGAMKLETLSQRADPIIVALGEAMDFQNVLGRDRIERRIKVLSGYLKNELIRIPGVRLHTSEDPYLSGGLTAFSIEGIDPEKIVNYVREKYNIVIRTVGSKEKGTYGVRVSTPTYVSFKHIELFLEGIKTLVNHKG
jgi:isopenicillin-N epimerase